MENYSLTVRQIRLSKGFSLKEIYTGILSKSFAIDFEKGLYDIKFHLMLKILDRLMISVDELLLIHNEYQRLRCYEPLLNINLERLKHDPAYSSDIECKLHHKAETEKTSSAVLEYMEVVALKAVFSNKNYQTLPEYRQAKNYIQRYLFDVETWTLSEFRIFSDMSFLFENGDVKISLFLTAWNTLERYQAHPDFQIYLPHLLVNNLYQLIYYNHFDLAQKAIDRLRELTDDVNMLAWRVPLFYYEGLLYYATGKEAKGMAEIEKAKQIYSLSGNHFMVEQIEIGLDAIKSLNTK
ncbi:hypothetical protein AALA80_12220 [Oscillospiraceae bacterium 50-60]